MNQTEMKNMTLDTCDIRNVLCDFNRTMRYAISPNSIREAYDEALCELNRLMKYKKEECEMNNDTHEEYVRQIRAVGESLIKNAESIVGSAKNLSGIDISVYVNSKEVPEVSATQRFYPEKM